LFSFTHPFALARACLALCHVEQLVYNAIIGVVHFAEGLEPLPSAGAYGDRNKFAVFIIFQAITL